MMNKKLLIFKIIFRHSKSIIIRGTKNHYYWKDFKKIKYVIENMLNRLVKKVKVYLQGAVLGKKIFIMKKVKMK